MTDWSEKMLCERCGKNEAVTRIQHLHSDGSLEEVYLCESCANLEEENKIQAFNELALSFLSMLDGNKVTAGETSEKKQLVCDSCGLDFDTFRKTNRAGCPDCYDAFYEQILQAAKQVQGGHTKHVGKVPDAFVAESEREERILALREQIQKMIELENFEEAARLRDEIRSLEGKAGEEE
ncbi:UvrB/UvrC motif-containing protein [Listeria valentina]|uniref:UvrB/UvrC motif-containing protein n=1 Tax=Listeria valentina TaxID=2705293 RepID=UPI001FE57756|nr:UvrB/UvrC motif-containing protein [Listeria valentina]